MGLSVAPVVHVAFGGVWTDVSSYCRLARWKRGRSSDRDNFPAGRASVVLDNRDRRFDPEYATGPYYGDLLPRVPIRIGASKGGETFWRFRGFVDGWPQAYTPPNDATCTVSATDAFKVFARAWLPSVWQQTIETATTVATWLKFGEGTGTEAADASGNKNHGTYAGGATFNSRASLIYGSSNTAIGFDGVDDHVTLPFSAAVDTNAAFTIEFWIEMSEAVGANDQIVYEQSQGQATDAAGVVSILVRGTAVNEGQVNVALISSGTSAILDSGVRVDDGGKHHVAVTADGSFLRLYVDGTLAAGPSAYTALSSPVSWLRIADGKIGSGVTADGFRLTATLDEFVIHNDDLSAATVLEHYNAGTAPWDGDTPGERLARILDYLGWPSTDRLIDTGSAVLVPAVLERFALPHMQEVEITEGGRLYMDSAGRVRFIARSAMWDKSGTIGGYARFGSDRDYTGTLIYAPHSTSQAVFGDDHSAGELPYQITTGDLFDYDDEKIVNDARVTQAGGSEQVALDVTSIDSYGVMSHTESSLEQRVGVIKNRAEYLVHKHAQPSMRVPAITIKPEHPADTHGLYDVLLNAELAYRYTVRRRPQALGDAIEKEVQLESIGEQVVPGDYTAECELSPAEPYFWTWDESTWETGDLAAAWSY